MASPLSPGHAGEGWQPGRGARPGQLREPWLASLRAEGLDGSGAAFQVQGATAAGNYVGKWGAAEELALSGKKSGRAGRSPFQLLADYADQNDARAGALFAESLACSRVAANWCGRPA